MTSQELKNSILQFAVQGKLVPQNQQDEPASILLKKIKTEREKLILSNKIRRERPLSLINEEEISFEIPESWEWVRLGDIGYIQTGTTPSTLCPEYFGNEIPFIKPADISFTGINYFNEGLTYLGSGKSRVIEKNSVLMVCIGGSIGKCFHIDRDVCCNQQINAISPIVLNNNYLFNVFCSDYFYKTILRKATGTATPIINKSSWSELIIPLPPLAEQQRIVDKIEELLPYVEQYGTAESELIQLNAKFPEQLKKSILQYAVQGKLVPQNSQDEPAIILLKKIITEKKQLIKEKKIREGKLFSYITDDEKPFEIPESWVWCRLNDVGNFRKGPFGSSITKSMFVPKSENSIKVYEQKNAIQKDNKLGDYYIDKKYFEEKMRGFEVYPNDIIVSCAGTIGETYVMPEIIEQGIINQALMKMEITPLIDKNFFLMYFDYVLKKSAQSTSKGSAIKNIPPFDIFKKLLFPLPPLSEQKLIVEKVEEVLGYCEKLK